MSTGAFFIDKIIIIGYMQVYSDRQKQNLTPQSAVAFKKKRKKYSYNVYFKACLNIIYTLNQNHVYKTCYTKKTSINQDFLIIFAKKK